MRHHLHIQNVVLSLNAALFLGLWALCVWVGASPEAPALSAATAANQRLHPIGDAPNTHGAAYAAVVSPREEVAPVVREGVEAAVVAARRGLAQAGLASRAPRRRRSG